MPLFHKSLLLIVAATTFSTVTWASFTSSSSTAPNRPIPGARRDPEPVSAQRQGSPGSSSRSSPDNQGQSKSAAERKKLETELLNGIKTEILRRLGLPDNRTSVVDTEKESGGGEEMSNRSIELMRLMEDKEKQQEAMKDQMDHRRGGEGKTTQGGGKTNKVVLRTILFGEKVANLTDDSIVQFKLNQNSNRDLLVTAATVTVLVRPGRTGGAGHHRRQEADRLNIQIYALAENDTRPAGDPLTEVSVLAKRTKVQRLLLPTSYVQKAIDSQESVLRLKIVCDSCGVDDRDGGGGSGDPDRKGRKKGQPQTRSVAGGGGGQGKPKKRLRARNNLQNIPFLTISSKRKPPTTQRVRGRMQKTTRNSGK